MRWAGHVERLGEINAYKMLVGRHVGKRPLGRHKHRWEYNITFDLEEIGCKGVD
jgi:hypothetical protein